MLLWLWILLFRSHWFPLVLLFMLKIIPSVGQALDIPRHFSINEKDGFIPSDTVLIIRNDWRYSKWAVTKGFTAPWSAVAPLEGLLASFLGVILFGPHWSLFCSWMAETNSLANTFTSRASHDEAWRGATVRKNLMLPLVTTTVSSRSILVKQLCWTAGFMRVFVKERHIFSSRHRMMIVTFLLPLFVSARTIIICNYNPEEKITFGPELFLLKLCHWKCSRYPAKAA